MKTLENKTDKEKILICIENMGNSNYSEDKRKRYETRAFELLETYPGKDYNKLMNRYLSKKSKQTYE